MANDPGTGLTKRQWEILWLMASNRDEYAGELVKEKGEEYLGDTRVRRGTVNKFLLLCAISLEQDSQFGRGLERYRINETGLNLLGWRNE